MLEVRRQHPVFGIGTFEVLRPRTRRCSRTSAGSSSRTGTRHRAVRQQPSRFAQPVELHAGGARGQGPGRADRPGPVPADRRAAVLRHAARRTASTGSRCTTRGNATMISAERHRLAASRLPAAPALVRRGRPRARRGRRRRVRGVARRVADARVAARRRRVRRRCNRDVPGAGRPAPARADRAIPRRQGSLVPRRRRHRRRACARATTRWSTPSLLSRCSSHRCRRTRSQRCGPLSVEQSNTSLVYDERSS